MAKKLLDLSTEIKRDFVTIDGENHDLCAVDDVSLDEFIWLGRGINKVQAEMNSSDESDGDHEGELMQLLEKMTAKVIKAPPEVLSKLSDFSKLAIITAFFNQATNRGSPIKKKISSRPDSKGSTGEIRKTG